MQSRRLLISRAGACLPAVLVCLALSLSGLAGETAPAVGSKINIANVAAPAPYSQESPAIAAGTNGYLVVWQDRRNDADYDIYGAIVDGAGQLTGDESFLISNVTGNVGAPGDQKFPTVAFNGSEYLVAWEDSRSGLPHIRAARVSASGILLDVGGFAVSGTVNRQYAPAAAACSTGDWEVVWEEQPTGDKQIYAARVTSAGVAGTPVYLTNSAVAHRAPSIAWNGSSYLVAWEDYRDESTSANIYACLVSAAGAKTSGDILVSTSPTSWTVGAVGLQLAPSVAAESGGNWLVVWQDGRATPKQTYGARISSSGTQQDLGGLRIFQDVGDQEVPAVGYDGSKWVVGWLEKAAGRRAAVVRVNSTGQTIDSESILLSSGAIGVTGPAVGSRTGSCLVVYYNLTFGTSDVFGAALSSDGTPGTEVTISLAKQDQPAYAVAFSGSRYVAVWTDMRSGMYCLYAARITRLGSVMDPQGVLIACGARDIYEPAIAWNGTNFLVVWTEGRESLGDIKGMRLDVNLTKLDAAPLPICTATFGQNQPAVGWNGSYYLVTWTDSRYAEAPDYANDIFGARVGSDGAIYAISSGINLSTGDQRRSCVTSNGSDFLVAWEDTRSGTTSIYCTRVTSAGSVVSPAGLQVSSFASEKVSPAAAYDGANYLVVWSDGRAGFYRDIYGARLSPLAARLDANDIAVSTASGDQVVPSVAWNGDNYYVTWQDERNAATTSSDIYMARVSQFGSIIDPNGVFVTSDINAELGPLVIASGADLGTVFYSDFIYSTHRLVARSCGESAAVGVATVTEAKSRADGSRIRILSKVVTAGTNQIPGCFYIEEANRTSGIRVASNDPILEGYVVDVTGSLQTIDGERRIVATSVKIVSTGGTVPKPWGAGIIHLGGIALNAHTPGVLDGKGPNNIGLLVRTWGKVTSIGQGFFTIKDGSSAARPRPLPPAPLELKVVCPAGYTPPAVNSYVSVTGISSCEPAGVDSVRRVLMRKTSDVIVR